MKTTNLNIPAIYSITCIVSGKVYIGQTINIRKRWESHRHYLKRGTHRNHHLQRSWAKHGAEAFVFEVCATPLPGLPLEVALNDLEIEVLRQTPNAYNLNEVGEPRMKASAETRAKLSAERLARWQDPEYHARLVESQKKAHAEMTPEERAARGQAISEGQSAPEVKAKRSAISKAMWENPEHQRTQSERRKANWDDLDYRAQQTASRKASHADPEVKARRSASLKAAWARRKAPKAADEMGGEVL